VASAGIAIAHERLLSAISKITWSLGSPLHETPLFSSRRLTVPHNAMSDTTQMTARMTSAGCRRLTRPSAASDDR
jgi:hypothetical protein